MKAMPLAVLGILALGTWLPGPAAGADARIPGAQPAFLALAHPSVARVRGGEDALAASKYTRTAACLPTGGVSQAEVLVAAVTYLKEHPQHQGLPPGVLLTNALRQAYPCRR